MREYDLEQPRVRTKPVVSRSVLDDISEWWSGGETAERAPKPEPAVTKQDFEQSLSLVYTPVTLAHDALFGKTPDVAVAGSAAAKLGPAAAALEVLAKTKKDPGNQAAMRAPVADIQTAQTTLQVLAAGDKAPTLWHAPFLNAMSVIDSVVALPVADGIEQRDHDLLLASVKPTVQRLQDKTAGAPYVDFDPKTYTEGQEALSALGAVNIAQLKPAIAHVTKGVQAITAFAKSMQEQWDAAIASLEAAQQKLSQHSASYTPLEEAK
ncbi:MAG TPA: hypothetical protein VI300_02890 [Solirubrobacter sp.]